MKEKDLIKVIGVDWENVRKKLCSSEIEYNDIPRLKKENFFKWFDDMLTTSEDKAVTKLSNINLLLRSCRGKGHQKSRFKSLKQGDDDWEKYKDCLKTNRYNEPQRGFRYFGVSTNEFIRKYDDVKETCLREIRAFEDSNLEYVSTLQFKISDKYKDKKVFDFSKIKEYKDCDEIVKELEEYIYEIDNYIIKSIIEISKSKNIILSPNDISNINMVRQILLNNIIENYLVMMILKLVNDSTFKKIDKSKFADEKIDKEYAPFHAFANYIENKGYAGIIYNSTVHEGGLNLVLFNRDYVETEGEIIEEKLC